MNMKTIAFVAGACLLAFVVIGPQPVKRVVNETLNGGTLKGVEACVAYSKSELVSAETTRTACVERFQVNLYDGDLATGRAGPRQRPEGLALSGTLENKTSDHVTTWVKLRFYVFDGDGKETSHDADTYIWIEPNAKSDFTVPLPDLKPEDLKELKYCEHDDDNPKSCFAWGTPEVKGIKI